MTAATDPPSENRLRADRPHDAPRSAARADGRQYPARSRARSPRAHPTPRCWRRTIATWLIGLPLALALPAMVGQSPFSLRGSATPLLAGALALAGGALAARRWSGERVPDIAAGAFAAWVVLTMHTALYGTPFGFGGLVGDAARISAMAGRYATTLRSSDGIVGTIPSDYPPLFFWLIGRAAVLSGLPAWRLVGIAESLAMSAAIVCPYLLWRRLLPAGVALVVTLTGFAVFMDPGKPYEVLSLGVVLPWSLLTFASPERGRMHWLPAGVIGGLLIVLYWGYPLFAALGIAAIIGIGLRAPRRAAYARHVAGVAFTALLISSWYVVPYLSWALTRGLQATDRYQDPLIGANPFPFQTLTPIGVLTAVGVLGLACCRRQAWWATPLALMTLGAYAYRFVAELGFVVGGDTEVFQYTVHAVAAMLAVAGILTLAHAAPPLLRRLSIAWPAGAGTLIVCLCAVGAGTSAWYLWMPGGPPDAVNAPALTAAEDQASLAFLQPLPDGRYPRFAPNTGRLPWFPTDPIIRDVRSVLGSWSMPSTLSYSEQLFAVEPWRGYLGVGANAAASTSEWSARLAALQALSRVSVPSRFATVSAHTRFGPIDVFILYRGDGRWNWTATNYPATVSFEPAQFAASRFAVFSDLPDDTVLAVRRPISG